MIVVERINFFPVYSLKSGSTDMAQECWPRKHEAKFKHQYHQKKKQTKTLNPPEAHKTRHIQLQNASFSDGMIILGSI
jgi:hypothetical protein